MRHDNFEGIHRISPAFSPTFFELTYGSVRICGDMRISDRWSILLFLFFLPKIQNVGDKRKSNYSVVVTTATEDSVDCECLTFFQKISVSTFFLRNDEYRSQLVPKISSTVMAIAYVRHFLANFEAAFQKRIVLLPVRNGHQF